MVQKKDFIDEIVQERTRINPEFPTLVEFKLQSVGRGTLLTLVESGFGQLPKERRAEAYRMNSQGWDGQLRNIQKHLKG